MANDQEYATYSETGETFKDEGCQVPSPSLEKAGGRGGGTTGGRGGSKPTPAARAAAAGPEPRGPQGPGFVRGSCAGGSKRRSEALLRGLRGPLCRATARSASRAACLCKNSVDYNENTQKTTPKPSYCRAVMVLLRLGFCRALPKIESPYRRSTQNSLLFHLSRSHYHTL